MHPDLRAKSTAYRPIDRILIKCRKIAFDEISIQTPRAFDEVLIQLRFKSAGAI